MFDKILLLLALAVLSLPASIEPANAETAPRSTSTSKKRPAPPKRIPPNKVKPGGGLNAIHQACQEEDFPLTTLVLMDNSVLITRSHPSFWLDISLESGINDC